MNKELCCYLVTKDVLSQEYPFLEAIYSTLPICEKMVILDGYSEDGTFEILKTISSKNKKIYLYQAEWIGKTMGKKILYASKLARKKCDCQYVFQFQANEVIHEDTYKLLGSLPEIFPQYKTFSLPYMQFLREIPFTGEYRVRLHKNLDFIGPVGDAWTSGLEIKDLKTLILKDIFRSPKNILLNLGRGYIYSFAVNSTAYSKIVVLPKPIFRYYAVTPSGLLQKLKKHHEMNLDRKEDHQAFENIIQKIEPMITDKEMEESDVKKVFELGANLLQEMILSKRWGPKYYPVKVDIDDHPKIMRDLFKMKKYKIREEILEEIKNF